MHLFWFYDIKSPFYSAGRSFYSFPAQSSTSVRRKPAPQLRTGPSRLMTCRTRTTSSEPVFWLTRPGSGNSMVRLSSPLSCSAAAEQSAFLIAHHQSWTYICSIWRKLVTHLARSLHFWGACPSFTGSSLCLTLHLIHRLMILKNSSPNVAFIKNNKNLPYRLQIFAKYGIFFLTSLALLKIYRLRNWEH